MECQRDNIEIREATENDWMLIYELYSSLTTEDLYLRFFHFYKFSKNDAIKMTTGKDHVTFVVLVNGKIAGEGTLHLSGELSLVTRAEFRRMGIGSIIMKKIIERAKELGLRRLIFYTLLENAAMIALGRKFGFKLEEDEDTVIGVLDLDAKTKGRVIETSSQ
ncbi:N-acetyltransferase [Sulfolobales archaeon HS-7]|nr:N-acetyltransferase [Sulfolobales archaeon HS-7]